MKILTLFRHAKTERDSASGEDFDRRLIERGQQDSRRMGEEIRALGLQFDLVLSSPAARAAETAELAGLTPRFDERIYDAATSDLLGIVQAAPEEAGRLAMVGHNPGFERLASRLIGQQVEMPTGSLIEIALPAERWADVADASGRLVRFVRPKELR
jgi:phosphohistidine phosphatase